MIPRRSGESEFKQRTARTRAMKPADFSPNVSVDEMIEIETDDRRAMHRFTGAFVIMILAFIVMVALQWFVR